MREAFVPPSTFKAMRLSDERQLLLGKRRRPWTSVVARGVIMLSGCGVLAVVAATAVRDTLLAPEIETSELVRTALGLAPSTSFDCPDMTCASCVNSACSRHGNVSSCACEIVEGCSLPVASVRNYDLLLSFVRGDIDFETLRADVCAKTDAYGGAKFVSYPAVNASRTYGTSCPERPVARSLCDGMPCYATGTTSATCVCAVVEPALTNRSLPQGSDCADFEEQGPCTTTVNFLSMDDARILEQTHPRMESAPPLSPNRQCAGEV